jgi:hypothetical protein
MTPQRIAPVGLPFLAVAVVALLAPASARASCGSCLSGLCTYQPRDTVALVEVTAIAEVVKNNSTASLTVREVISGSGVLVGDVIEDPIYGLEQSGQWESVRIEWVGDGAAVGDFALVALDGTTPVGGIESDASGQVTTRCEETSTFGKEAAVAALAINDQRACWDRLYAVGAVEPPCGGCAATPGSPRSAASWLALAAALLWRSRRGLSRSPAAGQRRHDA